MKNIIPQTSIVVLSLVSVMFLMSYTRPAAEEPKEYSIVDGESYKQFIKDVNQKLAEGWHLQGGVTSDGHHLRQAITR